MLLKTLFALLDNKVLQLTVCAMLQQMHHSDVTQSD